MRTTRWIPALATVAAAFVALSGAALPPRRRR